MNSLGKTQCGWSGFRGDEYTVQRVQTRDRRAGAQIRNLQELADQHGLSVADEIHKLETKLARMKEDAYRSLTPLERVQLARHPKRPYTLDYIDLAFTDFIELHGDRNFRDDAGDRGRLGAA